MSLNPWIPASLQDVSRSGSNLIAENAAAVRSFASLEVSGRRLADLYETVSRNDSSAASDGLDQGGRILDAFLDVSRFHPIRVES